MSDTKLAPFDWGSGEFFTGFVDFHFQAFSSPETSFETVSLFWNPAIMPRTSEIELSNRQSQETYRTRQERVGSTTSLVTEEPGPGASNVTSAIPDGGYGWVCGPSSNHGPD